MKEEEEKKEEANTNTEELSEELQSYLNFKENIKRYVLGRQELSGELSTDEIIDICFNRMVNTLRYKSLDYQGSLYDKCAAYLAQYHSPAVNNDFQAAILITAWKAFIAGAKTRPSFTLRCTKEGDDYDIKNVDWVSWNGSLTQDGKIECLDYDVDGRCNIVNKVSNFSILMD